MKKLPTLNSLHRKSNKRQQAKRTKEEVSFYKTYKWKKTSENYRKRNPLCVKCLDKGRVKKANVVDHIKPIKEGGAGYDEENFQSLCHAHHNKKTKEDLKKK